MNKLLKINNDKAYFGINWALMNHCNYKCNYCHSDLNGGTIKHPKYEEVIFFVKKIIEHSSKLRFNPYFEFGGGEVTLLRYFPDLIRYICEHQGLVSIISNGSKSLKWWEQNVQFLNGVSLSYHVNDIKSETHFIKVAKILEASRITRLHVNVMMDPSQFEDCYAFAMNLKKQVKCSIALQPLFEGFGSGGITHKYTYTKEQEKLMQKFRGRPDEKDLPEPRAFLNVEYSDGSVDTLSTFDLLINDKVNFIGWDCYAGVESVVVTFSGDIYRAWCMQDGPIGSIYDKEINLPTKPTRCRTKICQCGAGISSTKINRNILRSKDNCIDITELD